jgi:hypothetical protein
MQTRPKTVTKTKVVMTANKQTAPELHFQEICLIESTTSFTDASLLLNNLSLRAFQIDYKTTCHNSIKPFFLRFETPKPDIAAKEIKRFGGEIYTKPSQLKIAYHTPEAKSH